MFIIVKSQFNKVHFFFNKDVIDKEKQAACEAADQGLCFVFFYILAKIRLLVLGFEPVDLGSLERIS